MSDKQNKTEIDFDFIGQLEGNSLKGYVPDPLSSQSGVTIASGFDIGQRSNQEIIGAFSSDLAAKLLPYSGLKRMAAYEFHQKHPLEITEKEASIINDYAHKKAKTRLRHDWDNSVSAISFDDLSGRCKTVIASVAFQYGSLAFKTPNFWAQVTRQDWEGAIRNLRSFGDKYETRRNKEADLLESWVMTKNPKLEFLNPKDVEPTGIDSRSPIIDKFDSEILEVVDKYVGVMTIAEVVGALDAVKFDIQLRARNIGYKND